MDFRPAIEADIPALATLFHETVMTHGPQHYSPAQTLAWAAAALDAAQFRHFILGVQTSIAETTAGMVGFGGLSSDGRVASLYVRHDCLGQGVGAAILQFLIEQAEGDRLPRLYAEASEFSLGLFQKFGFRHYDTEVVERLGVSFTRYLVERELAS